MGAEQHRPQLPLTEGRRLSRSSPRAARNYSVSSPSWTMVVYLDFFSGGATQCHTVGGGGGVPVIPDPPFFRYTSSIARLLISPPSASIRSRIEASGSSKKFLSAAGSR